MTIIDAQFRQAGEGQGDLPSALQGSVERHRKNLAALVISLRAAGFDEQMIETSVRQLVDSYGNELTAAIRALIEERSDAA